MGPIQTCQLGKQRTYGWKESSVQRPEGMTSMGGCAADGLIMAAVWDSGEGVGGWDRKSDGNQSLAML